MFESERLDLQFFADGAGDGAAAGDGGQAMGETTAAAGQDNSVEARLSQLGVPQDRIEKFKKRKAASRPAPVPAQTAAATEPAVENAAEDTGGEAPGVADRKPWEEIRDAYKEEIAAETQGAVKKRIKNLQEKIQQYEDREGKTSVLIDFMAARYGMDPDNLDIDQLLEHFRKDNSLSEAKANELGTTDEIAHRLELAEQEEARRARTEQRKQKLQETFDRQALARNHFDELTRQAAEFQKKVPGFDLIRALDDDAFAEMTRPGSKITVEAAYYALHPELRQSEVEAAAQKAREAVSASVRSGSERPRETGSQAASLGNIPYRDRPKAEREDLKRRIREAGYRGEHIRPGG